MYDLPPLRSATDAWWNGLASAFSKAGVPDVPASLTRGRDLVEAACAPDMLFDQTCGYPLTHGLKGKVTLLATPQYDCPEASGSAYCSLLLVRDDDPAQELADLRCRPVAINGYDSQSGFSTLRASLAPLAQNGRFAGDVLVSGGHGPSMAMVQDGRADLCAVDCVTYRLWEASEPASVAGLRILGTTPAAPNLPYITRKDAAPDLIARLREGLFEALADPALASARQALMLKGAEVLPLAAYDRILEIEEQAIALGYPTIE